MTTTTPAQQALRELDRRVAGGVEITLLWNRSDNSVIVSIRNAARGKSLQFTADPHRARDAFSHPFAYAIARGLPHTAIARAA